MIRATDDVEKVRMFIGQGLLHAGAGAVVLLTGTLIILFFTNARLTLVDPADPAGGAGPLHGLRHASAQPMFMQGAA